MNEATILIADDDRAIRTVLTQAFGRLGYRGARVTAMRRPCGAGFPTGRATWSSPMW